MGTFGKLLFAAFMTITPWASFAASAPVAAGSASTLNQAKIHDEYNEGNFESVTAVLESFMAKNKTYSLEDSIFIAKHLAVVYSANPKSREKGKYYMYRLLAMLPSAKLIDMYVSDEIDRIFDKVREEYLSRQKSFGVDSTQVSVPQKSPSRQEREGVAAQERNSAAGESEKANAAPARSGPRKETRYLIAGGTVLMAAGVAAYFMFNDSPTATEKTYVVP
ncbi:MAG: hypothetical protein M3Y08_11045 [Fibrobacterota bacterium]|nr:hypothetical protein [Fibrobacterota bacterium]